MYNENIQPKDFGQEIQEYPSHKFMFSNKILLTGHSNAPNFSTLNITDDPC